MHIMEINMKEKSFPMLIIEINIKEKLLTSHPFNKPLTGKKNLALNGKKSYKTILVINSELNGVEIKQGSPVSHSQNFYWTKSGPSLINISRE